MYAVISPSDSPAIVGKKGVYGPPAGPVMQRSSGSIELVFSAGNGLTRTVRNFQEGTLKARFPNVAIGGSLEAVLINIAGGMTGGDSQSVTIEVQTDANVVVTTQACERLYRSSGDDAVITGRLRVAAGSKLEWLPQPLIFFDGARLKRETHVDLSADAGLLAVEAVIFGRKASGETVEYGSLSDAWFIRRADIMIHADRFHAAGTFKSTLLKPSVLDGNRAMAMIRYVALDANDRLVEMRAILEGSGIVAAASAWNGYMLVRFAAPDGYTLNRDLIRVLEAFRNAPMPKVWSL